MSSTMTLPRTVGDRARGGSSGLATTLAIITLVAAVVGGLSSRDGSVLSGLAFLLLFLAIGAIIVTPVAGLYVAMFFAPIGDTVTTPWFPFTKNFSGHESIMFVANGLVVSPFDVILVVTLISWLARIAGTRGARPVRRSLTGAVIVFTGFVVFGYVRGLQAGANLHIALIEGRPLFYIAVVYVLATNLCDRHDFRRMMWVAVGGITVNALVALWYLTTLTPTELATREDLGQHSAAVFYATVIVLVAALYMFRGASRLVRRTLLVVSIPSVIALTQSQRRAAMIGLGVAIALMILSLLWRDRRRFWHIAPAFVILVMGYSAAFWNSTSSIAIGAQAVKSVVAPDDIVAKDSSSDIYRIYENIDLNYTIRQSPVLGIGFGQPFQRPIALPAITRFELDLYVAHNSILWMWLKVGFLGFVTMMWLFARGISDGVARLLRERDATQAAVIMAMLGYVVAFAVFTYVDISWDATTVLFLSVALAALTSPPVGRTSRQESASAETRRDDVTAPASQR